MRQLVLIASDDLIAGILNRNGRVTGHGNRWMRERVTRQGRKLQGTCTRFGTPTPSPRAPGNARFAWSGEARWTPWVVARRWAVLGSSCRTRGRHHLCRLPTAIGVCSTSPLTPRNRAQQRSASFERTSSGKATGSRVLRSTRTCTKRPIFSGVSSPARNVASR
jgi:hypothetical protein